MAEYAEREIMDQKYYAKHVSAMTSECLHCKSDIAAELAHRDELIEELRAANKQLKTYISRLEAETVVLGTGDFN